MLKKLINTNRRRRIFFSTFLWNKIRKQREFAKLCRKHTEYFLRVWLFYNEKILANLKSLPADRFMVINYDTLNNKDKEVAAFLVDKWNFSLEYFSFSKIFKKELFSESFNIESYIKDKTLITRAKNLNENLMSFVPA